MATTPFKAPSYDVELGATHRFPAIIWNMLFSGAEPAGEGKA